jgi:hypothetical protein
MQALSFAVGEHGPNEDVNRPDLEERTRQLERLSEAVGEHGQELALGLVQLKRCVHRPSARPRLETGPDGAPGLFGGPPAVPGCRMGEGRPSTVSTAEPRMRGC